MAARVRRWAVRPDTSVLTETYGEIPCVSRQAMVEAIMDGEAFLARTGGVLTVIVGRHPTDLPGEAVTTNAVIEWKDGPRATVDDAERPSSALPAEKGPGVGEVGDMIAAQDAMNAERAEQITGEGEDGAVVVPDEPDGFDRSTLEEEDVSAIPEPLR